MLDHIVRQRGKIARYRQIAQVLVRHGFGYLVSQVGLGYLVPFHWGLFGHPRRAIPYTQAEHLRLAFQELGATFIKLGQILSTRSDLLPPQFIAELSKLQDAVPPHPGSVIMAQITQDLGKPTSEIFETFDKEPLGSASIGQVHAARLFTGEEVVIKVQRPGIERLVDEDIAILYDVARLASGRTVWGQIYDLVGIVEEFSETLHAELDYVREEQNAERIRRNFAGDAALIVPRVYKEYTTKHVLTMERLRGIKISDLEALDAAGIDRHRLAETLTRIILKMVLENGFFHADPHPGNYLIQNDGSIGLLDYGIVGHLDVDTRDNLVLLFASILERDTERVIDRLVDIGVVGTTFQLERLQRDVGHLISSYYGRPLGELDITQILQEFLDTARRHRLQIPSKLTLLGKTLSMYQAIARQLDPKFNLAEMLGPYVQRLALERYWPPRLASRLVPVLTDLSRLAITLPRRLDRLSIQAERGNFSMNIRIPDAEHYLSDLDRMVNRLILGIITAGFIVGLSFLLVSYQQPQLAPLIGWLFGFGFLLASAIGFWLMLTIIRGGHH